ncbi:unnamed protein product [Musa acuminata var. zebrina]
MVELFDQGIQEIQPALHLILTIRPKQVGREYTEIVVVLFLSIIDQCKLPCSHSIIDVMEGQDLIV